MSKLKVLVVEDDSIIIIDLKEEYQKLVMNWLSF